ncbi:MAG: glycyl radical protein [Ruminococcaceae bacterium]|nr:glycyl radical protein [Oscillospiraceae bacterium]
MKKYTVETPEKTARIDLLKQALFDARPQIESDRAVLLTQSYMETEGEPMVIRRAKAFKNICENLPVTIRDNELIVGSSTVASKSCQIFPEFSFDWVEKEFDTLATRSADPFYISEETKKTLSQVFKYWKGKTTSELATSYMSAETITAIEHNIFTPGNYFYNGVGHVCVHYDKVLALGYNGIIAEAEKELEKINVGDADYVTKSAFLEATIMSCRAAITYANRYAKLALDMAEKESDDKRKKELLRIALNCSKVPANPAENFYEACQSFWFVQLLLQTESNGHSISPGRFDQYMYPYYEMDKKSPDFDKTFAQELIDCLWIKFNDISKVRDDASAQGFAGYGTFQNLIAGGQTIDGEDATNDLSFMTIAATMHVLLPQPSFSVRVWNKTPHEFLVKAAELTRTGVGLPAYYNDEVIIPSLVSRGLTMQDARDYNIIGCVEPQKSGKTWGWHDAAFFNMCRPLELVFSSGIDNGKQISVKTKKVEDMTSFEEFYDAYKQHMDYMIGLMVNSNNAIDVAHAERCPLPFLASMIDDCIKRGKTPEQGGAVYNFSGPQGFGIANMADSLYAIRKLVFEEKKFTLSELKEALANNYGKADYSELVAKVVKELQNSGVTVGEKEIEAITKEIVEKGNSSRYAEIREMILDVAKFGNDIEDIDALARDVAYTYTKPLEKYKNPRGGMFQAGLYPVSANVPLGAQTGATPDGRYAYTPVADGVSPSAGRDVHGPTASANSVSKLDHGIASNGTLFNMKFHPSALEGTSGIESFIALIRGYFDQKGSHVQFNVVSRETLRDAQAHPEKYQGLVVRVAGYSALFTTLSKSLQDDIINRTEQGMF